MMEGKLESSVLQTLPMKLSGKLFPTYKGMNGQILTRHDRTKKTEANDTVVGDDSDDEIVAPRLKRKTSFRRTLSRSLSYRFKSLKSFRNKHRKTDEIVLENRDESVHKDKENNNHLPVGLNINIQKVGLNREFGKKHKKIIPRKFKPGSDLHFQRQSPLSRLRNSFRRKDMSVLPLSSGPSTDKQSPTGAKNLSVYLCSRLGLTPETVDFSHLVRPVNLDRKQNVLKSDAVLPAKPRKPANISISEKENFSLPLNILSPISPPCVSSPTCADVYGQDEEEGPLAHLAFSAGITNSVLCTREGALKVFPEHTNSGSCTSKVDSDMDKTISVQVHILEGEVPLDKHNKAEYKASYSGCPSPDGKLDKMCLSIDSDSDSFERTKYEGQKALRDSLSDIPALPVLDFDLNQTFESPWVLKDDKNQDLADDLDDLDLTKKYGHLVPLVIKEDGDSHSLGFDVNEQFYDAESEPVNLARTVSNESVDSFSSSFHSVHSQDVLFSESEPEVEADVQSVSSSDSGTFENMTDSYTQKSKSDTNLNSCKVKEKTKINKQKGKAKQSDAFQSDKSQAKTPRSFFGIRPFSFDDSATKKSTIKDKLSKRRSLDSNLKIKEMSLELEETVAGLKSKMTTSTDSGLSSALSPLMETTHKTGSVDDAFPECDEVTKFFTMPNPKKHKSGGNKRRVSRIGSISKKITEKAQSISNIKLGSSFKIRSDDSEKPKIAPFFKTKSLTNLMAKKGAEMASSISYFIRGRSNSATSVDSPFKQGTKQQKCEKTSELVYEKVFTTVPRKRPASKEEISAWKKRLRLMLNLKFGHNAFSESEFRSRTDSVMNRSQSGVRSPTLLDEIMKSVDTQYLRGLCDDVQNDDNYSDGEASSMGSSQYLGLSHSQSNYEHMSNVSSRSDRGFIAVCKECGKVRHASSGSESSEPDNMIESAVTRRAALSLCDLTSQCSCKRNKPSVVTSAHVLKAKGYDTDKISKDSGTDVSSPESYESDSKGFKQRRCLSMSLIDMKQIESALFPSFKKDFTKPKRMSGDFSLLRHRPVLDLSADDLDNFTDDTDDEVQTASRNQRNSLQKTNLSQSENCDLNIPFSVKPGIEYAGDEIFTLCSEMPESQDYVRSGLKAHSCSDLLHDAEVEKCDKPQRLSVSDTMSKKEARVVKVKSMSSSHDALLTVMAEESADVLNDFDALVKSVDQADLGQNLDCLAMKDIKDKPESVNIAEINIIGSTDHDENKNIFDTKSSDPAHMGTLDSADDFMKCKSEKPFRSQEQLTSDKIQGRNITRKPPLPRNVRRSKVLSANDIDFQQQGKSTESSDIKRFSFSDLNNDNENGHIKSTDHVKTSTPKADKTSSFARRFLFDDQHVTEFKATLIQSNRLNSAESGKRKISASNDDISLMNEAKPFDTVLKPNKRSLSEFQITQSPKSSWSEEVFSGLSIPIETPNRLPSWSGFPKEDPFFSGLPDVQGTLDPDLETVVQYDVCLGYMLHSIQCDDKVICVYSLQRNKQLMDSVITPLAALPGAVSPQKVSSPGSHGNPNKTKPSSKIKVEELPNPAAPLTAEPSDRLAHAGCVLRTVLLTRASHMIRDRKFHLRTYRRCMVGTEMVDWLMQQSPLVHSRTQAVGMWQALVEEGVVVHVCHEHQFKDKYLFYRFHEDDEGVSTVPTSATKRESEEELADVFLLLAQIGPDAMMRMILRKRPHERTMEDLEIIYEELLHIKALSHLSTMVKRELASVLVFESHARAGTVLFNQGDEGTSWYIILKGSVNVVIYGKGVVCTLHEGDDFGKLALVNDAPRAATIVLRDDNCHFLRVDKDDFNRILRDVEANTVRLKEHGQDVLVLEKIPSNTQSSDGVIQAHYKYSVMAGTPEKMLEHLLESRIDNRHEAEIDGFLEDFLLTHVIFMPYNHLCPVLISHYHSSMSESSEQEAFEFMLNHKKCVLHFVEEWANIVGSAFHEDPTIRAFLEELRSCVMDDLNLYPSLKDDLVTLETIINSHSESSEGRPKKRNSSNFSLTRKHSKDNYADAVNKKKSIKHSDENIVKVYCADHTYATVKLPMDTTVETLLSNAKQKLGLGEDLVLCEVKSTGERVIFKDNDLCVTTALSINGRLFVTPKEHLDALTPLPEQEEPTDGSFNTLEMFSSREMAYFMTLYDWELFSYVQEYELIYQVFGRFKFGKITANLDLFLRRFNEIQFWVVTEMVLTANLSKRVTLLRKFIKLASYCKEHQNLNSFFAIVMGLSNIAVSRLSQTWEKLPGKFKKMFADFETLMDPSRNHRVYRLSVAKMAPPIIPFMPLLMKDMTFTHEGNKTYFDGLVNFEKMHMISQTLKTVRFCRSMNLELEAPGTQKSTEVSSYIRNLRVIDNQRYLTQLSHKLEPRKS